MRVSIIRRDGIVTIDGESYSGLDLSSMDPSIHAVQWYGTEGEIEWKEAHPYKLLIVQNEPITSLDTFQFALDAWATTKATNIAEQAAAEQLLAEQLAAEQPTTQGP
jgi:hypothetical protein